MHGNETAMPSLKGARVLVVQNDPFVAADVDLMIDEAEGEVVALATSPKDALWLLDHESIDTAVVDPNLGDHEAASVMEALSNRGIPFVAYPETSTANTSPAQSSPWARGLVTALAIGLKLMPALEQTQFLI
jgi:DNA-binding NarL/FixJ family response regulator